MHKENLKVFT